MDSNPNPNLNNTDVHTRKLHIRFAHSISVGLSAIGIALSLGMWGYHHFEKMSWVDAFVNASMILSGMGPLGNLSTVGGKIFAGIYALFSGLFFILIVAFIFSPLIHRFFTQIKK